MKQTVCDVCGGAIVGATETHHVAFCDNSTRRVDCCLVCRSAIENGDMVLSFRLAKVILKLPLLPPELHQ